MDVPPFPQDLSHWRQQIAESLSDWLSVRCEGAIAVDQHGQVIWVNQTYLEALCLPLEQVLGVAIDKVTPHTRMREVLDSGEPILLDVFSVHDRTFIISRVPIKNALGRVMGAIGFALYETRQHLKPLLAKFSRLEAELASARQALTRGRCVRYTLADIVGQSAAMQDSKRCARRAARTEGTVLLLGETGTGKELFAQAIHAESPRAAGPFIALNVAAIPEHLLESELFGAVAGAYTGVDRKGREGKIRLAHQGSLFLDEIGDLPLSLQAKLLRVLQEREIEPLGSNRLEKVDIRVIAATSRDLAGMVERGEFRADLYYRLHVLPLTLPPLRARRDDIPALCEHILARIAERDGQAVRDIPAAGLQLLAGYHWPGNLRELWNVLEMAVAMHDGPMLGASELQALLPVSVSVAAAPSHTLAEQVAEFERRQIEAALLACGGRVVDAAKRLGLGRATLYKKMVAYGLDVSELRRAISK